MTFRATNQTIVTLESDTIYTSRIVNAKVYAIESNVKDLQELVAKVDRIAGLSDDNYMELSMIQKRVLAK